MKQRDNSKQRLVEVMTKLDKRFKPETNEEVNTDSPDISWRDIKEGMYIHYPNLRLLYRIYRMRSSGPYADTEGIVYVGDENRAAMWEKNVAELIRSINTGDAVILPQSEGVRLSTEYKSSDTIDENNLNETGEWVGDEDDTAWLELLKSEVQKIENATDGKLKLIDVRGFDKYQGPYAIVDIQGSRYKIWTAGDSANLLLWIDDFMVDNTSREGMRPGYMGTTDGIIEMLNNKLNETQLNETSNSKVQELAKEITKTIIMIDDNLGYDDFAAAIAIILSEEYGSHNFQPFINVLSNELSQKKGV